MIKLSKATPTFERTHLWGLVYGLSGSGRTTWALSAPGPIVFVHDNDKTDWAISLAAQSKDVFPYHFRSTFRGTPSEVKKAANEQWAEVSQVILEAYTWARTLIIDTETSLWELARLAYFGDAKPMGGNQFNWDKINADYKSLFKQFRYQEGTNLIVVDRGENERDAKGAPLPTIVPKGQKDQWSLADFVVETSAVKAGDDHVYNTTVAKCGGLNSSTLWQTYPGEAGQFPVLASLLTGLKPDVFV